MKSLSPASLALNARAHLIRKGLSAMDQQERQRKKALIILQIVVYGYLALMFGIQLYMSFARGWWNL